VTGCVGYLGHPNTGTVAISADGGPHIGVEPSPSLQMLGPPAWGGCSLLAAVQDVAVAYANTAIRNDTMREARAAIEGESCN
jgi:hypothetical protein